MVDPNKEELQQVSIPNSDVFTVLQNQAIIGCQNDQQSEACQTLANLCVLQMYDQASTSCYIFQQLFT